jgi:hypothetical protein
MNRTVACIFGDIVKVVIVKEPRGVVVDGVPLDRYRAKCSYDMVTWLANYLVADGFAVFDRRRSAESRTTNWSDRRRLIADWPDH